MGAVALIGAAITAAASIYSAETQRQAQNKATRVQQEAAAQQQKVNKNLAERSAAQQQQANNKAQANMIDASSAFSNTPDIYNPSNLTGGLGIDSSLLDLGGSSLLGGGSKIKT